MLASSDVILIGHPFARIGRGEDIRSAHRALRANGITPGLRDVYEFIEPDPVWQKEFGPSRVRNGRAAVAIYFLNGDEIDDALLHLGDCIQAERRIVYPAWELERYPSVWGQRLEHFDEVWAVSGFVAKSLSSAVSSRVVSVPLAVEPEFDRFLNREWFGLPDGAYIFLFCFDFKSYTSRKNPMAVVEAFDRLAKTSYPRRPVLVIKSQNDEQAPELCEELAHLMRLRDDRHWINESIGDREMKNLLRVADCFVSLHRSEGFGRGLAEAMFLGKPVIGTAYSGNLDYMTKENSLLVGYDLVDCSDDEYPFGNGQVWANPRVDEAASLMSEAAAHPERARRIGRLASRSIRAHNSYLAVGRQIIGGIERVL